MSPPHAILFVLSLSALTPPRADAQPEAPPEPLIERRQRRYAGRADPRAPHIKLTGPGKKAVPPTLELKAGEPPALVIPALRDSPVAAPPPKIFEPPPPELARPHLFFFLMIPPPPGSPLFPTPPLCR